MEPTSQAGNTISFTHELPVNNQHLIKNNALTEAIKRLKLKFPGQIIEDYQVQFIKMDSTNFTDGSLGFDQDEIDTDGSLECEGEEIYTEGIESGYCVSFNYNNELFHLHTTDGSYFSCKELNIEQYPENILNLIIVKLSKTTGKEVLPINIVLNVVKKTKGTLHSFSDCNKDLYRYMSEDREDVFVIKVTFDGTKHSFCMNEKGQTMHEEI